MRLLHIDTAETLRGGQIQLLILARGLRGRGHGQLIVCPESSVLAKRAVGEGFNIFELPANDPGHWNGSFQLRQRLLTEPFDIVHAHDADQIGSTHQLVMEYVEGTDLKLVKKDGPPPTPSPARPLPSPRPTPPRKRPSLGAPG